MRWVSPGGKEVQIMSNDLQILKRRMQRNNLLVTDPEIARASIGKMLASLFLDDDDYDACSACTSGCYSGCLNGCSSTSVSD